MRFVSIRDLEPSRDLEGVQELHRAPGDGSVAEADVVAPNLSVPSWGGSHNANPRPFAPTLTVLFKQTDIADGDVSSRICPGCISGSKHQQIFTVLSYLQIVEVAGSFAALLPQFVAQRNSEPVERQECL